MIYEDGNCVGKKGDREMKEYIYNMIDLRNALDDARISHAILKEQKEDEK